VLEVAGSNPAGATMKGLDPTAVLEAPGTWRCPCGTGVIRSLSEAEVPAERRLAGATCAWNLDRVRIVASTSEDVTNILARAIKAEGSALALLEPLTCMGCSEPFDPETWHVGTNP
jgi:hypothetical protein